MFRVEPLLILAVVILVVVVPFVNTTAHIKSLVRFCANDSADNRKLANCFGVYSDDNLIVANGECLRHSKIKKYHMYAGDPNMNCDSEEGQTQETNGFLKINEIIDIIALKNPFVLNSHLFWAKIVFPLKKYKDKPSIYELTCFTYTANVKRRYETKVYPCEPSSRDDDVQNIESICGTLKISHPVKEHLEFLPVLCDDNVVGFITNITDKTFTIRRGTEAERKNKGKGINCLSYRKGGGKEAEEQMIFNMLQRGELNNEMFVKLMGAAKEQDEKCKKWKKKIKPRA